MVITIVKTILYYFFIAHLCIRNAISERLGGGAGGGGYYLKLFDARNKCPLHSFCYPWNILTRGKRWNVSRNITNWFPFISPPVGSEESLVLIDHPKLQFYVSGMVQDHKNARGKIMDMNACRKKITEEIAGRNLNFPLKKRLLLEKWSQKVRRNNIFPLTSIWNTFYRSYHERTFFLPKIPTKVMKPINL